MKEKLLTIHMVMVVTMILQLQILYVGVLGSRLEIPPQFLSV